MKNGRQDQIGLTQEKEVHERKEETQQVVMEVRELQTLVLSKITFRVLYEVDCMICECGCGLISNMNVFGLTNVLNNLR